MNEDGLQRQAAEAGKTAGTFAGMLGGARLGQMAIPVPVLGTLVGGVVGGLVGNELGQRLGRALVDGAAAFLETMSSKPEAASQTPRPLGDQRTVTSGDR